MNWPSFSIIVPTYERRAVVCDCLRALCAINYAGAVELLVVIDGSTDGTEAAVEEIAFPFPARTISQANAGAAAARNHGAREARNEILLFLDDDMMCRPDILVEHARTLAEGADAVVGHIPLEPKSTPGFLARGVERWAEGRAQRLAGTSQLTLFDLLTGQLSVRRSVFKQIGGFDQSFTARGTYGDEDLDLGTRLTKDFSVRFNADAVSYQRYVITPAQHMRQWYEAGQADVSFARKHPGRARELFGQHGANSRLGRYVLRPLAGFPLLPRLLTRLAVWLATREQQLPSRLRRPMTRFFYTARRVRYWQGVRKAGGIPASGRALVLCYHAITDLSGDAVLREYGIPAPAFARQLDSLKARGFSFASPDEIVALLDHGSPVPERTVLLTFDDCYEELPEIAATVLRPRGIPAVAFAVSGMTSNEWDERIGAGAMRLLDGDGLRLLRSRGVEIGCHSRNHRPLPKLNDEGLVEETSGAADDLAKLGLPRPRFFAFPYGAQDRRSRAAVEAAGFVAAFGLSARHLGGSSDRFALPRIEILASDRAMTFRLKTRWPRLAHVLLNGPDRVRSSLRRKLRRTKRGNPPSRQQPAT